jgi:sorting nexin-4
LKQEVVSSNDVSEKFSDEVVKEYEVFQTIKTAELKDSLLAYADKHVEFYRQVITLYCIIYIYRLSI